MVEAGDESMWARASGGDERAFAGLFDRYYQRVFRHAVQIGGHHADADEVSAATFLMMWELRARVRVVNSSVLPWLLVTAGNLARNEGRRVQRYRRVLDQMPRDLESVDAAEVVAEQDFESRRAAALSIALRGLSLKDAQLMELTAIGEVPVADAARLLGLSPGAARVRLHRARRRLRDSTDLPEQYSLQEEPS